MEPDLLRIPATDAELSELREIEEVFEISKSWGYDPSGHTLFEARSYAFPLGSESQEYTDVVFRNFRRAGTGEPLFFESDIGSKFEHQSELSEITRSSLQGLVADYLDTHPKPGARVRLAAFASDVRSDSSSAVHYGIRQGVAQLLAIADGRWEIVSMLKRRALDAFATVRSHKVLVLREEGSGDFDGWDFWITFGPDGAGGRFYPVGKPECAIIVGNYNEDETLIDDDDYWKKVWNSWSEGSPKTSDLAPFAEYVEGLRQEKVLSILR